MMKAPVQPPAEPSHYEEGSDAFFDWRAIAQYSSYALGSVLRRPLLFTGVLVSVVGLAHLAVKVLPATYEVQTRLLAQRNAALVVRGDLFDSPGRAASELIVRRDNLLELMRQTNLVAEWRAHRPPAGRWKDALFRFLGRQTTDAELETGLLHVLQKQLVVWTTPEGAVGIEVRWPDPNVAYRLADAAQRNFLEMRHVLEVSTLSEQIAILESHAAELGNEVQTHVAKLERMREERSPPRRPSPVRRLAPSTVTPEVARLQTLYEARRRAITDLEQYRTRALFEAQTRLAELKATYSENHPALLDQQEKVRALSSESPQLAHLRQEEEQLRQKLGTGRADPALALPAIPPDLLEFSADTLDDPVTDYERSQLRFALQQHAAMRAQIDAARIDLDTARAAFKYRYTVVVPPEKPRQPIKPNKPLAYVTAFLVGIVVALLSTTLSDLRKGRVLAAWQLQMLVGGRVIEVRRE